MMSGQPLDGAKSLICVPRSDDARSCAKVFAGFCCCSDDFPDFSLFSCHTKSNRILQQCFAFHLDHCTKMNPFTSFEEVCVKFEFFHLLTVSDLR
jgi:hypothetical protein